MSKASTEQVVTTPIVDESSWKQELEQLDRLLTGRFTEAQAKEHAQSELARHDGIVNTIEKQIAQAKDALAAGASFLPRADKLRLESKIESLDYDLATARKQREGSIRKCGEGIRADQDADKLRPRWQELRKRQQAIEAATNIGRSREPELRVSMPHRFVD
jgi:predicted ATPase